MKALERLSTRDRGALLALKDGPLSVRQLAARARLSVASAGRAVISLRDAGLMEGRSLTPKGLELARVSNVSPETECPVPSGTDGTKRDTGRGRGGASTSCPKAT